MACNALLVYDFTVVSSGEDGAVPPQFRYTRAIPQRTDEEDPRESLCRIRGFTDPDPKLLMVEVLAVSSKLLLTYTLILWTAPHLSGTAALVLTPGRLTNRQKGDHRPGSEMNQLQVSVDFFIQNPARSLGRRIADVHITSYTQAVKWPLSGTLKHVVLHRSLER